MKWYEIKLNEKYRNFVLDSEHNIFNILEGGVRSGKTTLLVLGFCMAIEKFAEDAVHIAFGESISLARAILGEGGSGLGIQNYFAENATACQYKGKDALSIKIRNTTQIVIFAGSGNSNSFESIRGLSIGCAVGTEVNLAHRSFIEEIVARTLFTPMHLRRIFFDLNPTIDSHYIYTDFIDRWVRESREGKLLGGVNYETVSLYDNPGLSDEQAEAIASQYDTTSNFYKALILGLRVNVIDTVYTLYDYNIEALNRVGIGEYIITCDIGISASATTFLAIGKDKKNRISAIDEYYHRNGKASIGQGVKEYEDYADDLITFYFKQTEEMGRPPRFVFIDKDISMLRILTRKFQENNIPTSKLQYVIKEKINQRITQTRNLLYLGEIVISDKLEYLPKAIQNAVYDQKEKDKGKLVRLDDTNLAFNPIDMLDSLEYGVSYFVKYKI